MKFKKEKIFNFSLYSFILLIFLSPIIVESETYYSSKIQSEFYNKEISNLISSRPSDLNDRHKFYSAAFLGRPYGANTLKGDIENKEVLVLNLQEMDCFTYLDYVHSLLYADDYYDFISRLRQTRYKNGIVSFKNRNHFFYDWAFNLKGVTNITSTVFSRSSIVILKNLNLKGDGLLFLPGIRVRTVSISYLEPISFNEKSLTKLKSGDYIGIYSEKEGLDVSHVGIIVQKDGRYYFRHASSQATINAVVDMDFLEYIKDKPGIIIYRNNH